MKKKTSFHFLLGLSALASAGSLVYRLSSRHRSKPGTGRLSLKGYLGDWFSADQGLHLQVLDAGTVILNEKALRVELIEVKNNELIFRDHLGYYLSMQKNASGGLVVYDEAEDKETLFEKK